LRFPAHLQDFKSPSGEDVAVTARSANAWWLLPGAFALMAVAVLDLRGGQLSGAAVDVGTGVAWYLAAALCYMARPANRAAWLFLLVATLLELGKGVGAAVSLPPRVRRSRTRGRRWS